MQNKKLTGIFSVVLVILFSLLLVNPAPAKTLKIGVLASLSGWFSGYDTALWEECRAVTEIWNEKGGLNIKGEKYKIELLIKDNKSTGASPKIQTLNNWN